MGLDLAIENSPHRQSFSFKNLCYDGGVVKSSVDSNDYFFKLYFNFYIFLSFIFFYFLFFIFYFLFFDFDFLIFDFFFQKYWESCEGEGAKRKETNFSFPFTIFQEGSSLARVNKTMKIDQKFFCEFKLSGELLHDLPNTIQELGENWGNFVCKLRAQLGKMSRPILESETGGNPLFFNKNLKAFNGPIIWIQQDLRKAH